MKVFSRKNLSDAKTTLKVSLRMMKIVWDQDPKLFIAYTISIIVPGVTPFINMYAFKLIIDAVVKVVSGEPYIPQTFYPLIALNLFSFLLSDGAGRLQGLLERLIWTKVPIRLNDLIYRKTSSLDMYYYEDDKFRDLLEKVRDSYQHRPQRLVTAIFYIIQGLVELLIALVAIIKLNWLFVPLLLIVSIPGFINQLNRSKFAYGIWDAESTIRKRFYYLTRTLIDYRDIKEIKLFKLGDNFLNEIKKIQTEFYLNNKKVAVSIFTSGLLFNLVNATSFIGIQVYIIYQALFRRITVGDISFYGSIVYNFNNALGGLMRNFTTVFENALFLKPMFDLFDAEAKIIYKSDGVKLELKKAPIIEFKDVSFSYPGSDTKILSKFNLVINPGEKVAFVGENGAGKTTLIKLLVRFYDVTEGEILINGVNIKDLDIESWYQTVGVLFQDFNKYDFKASENIHFGNIDQKYELEKIIQAAGSAGAHKMISKFDKQYNQVLGKTFEGGLELSGGQWQKIALSRAFYRNAPILVLDEPTSAIDAKAESEIFNRVERLSKDKTVIIISHRFSTVRNADRIYVFENGKVVENGTHKELMKKQGRYSKLFNLQAKGYQ